MVAMQSLKQKALKPDVELLQDFGDILTRSESVQQMDIPCPMNRVFSERPITGLIDKYKQFQVDIYFCHELTNLDFLLFEDIKLLRKSVVFDLEDVPIPSERFQSFASWGKETYTSGKQYWEVDVDESLAWAVGVCKDTRLRRNSTLITSADKFLLLSVKEDDLYNVFTTSPFLSHYIEKPLRRIGVYIDCDSGSVSFVNVDKSSPIRSYPDCSFDYPLKAFFGTDYSV
ncbi:PREDICTED: tripartite motif-containing protein 43-like [Elephantulus edwardii]|uniref:tripartite motif-containing protein 43-like n=1 Tax=Elephantulus edwardii TaxID=28737 RepID=UPI0003F0E780|nr:PREDICTED: tripartite motif-containing protein 43-like [Elephantulus edwardii]